jgi:hypothetical protein
MLTRRVYLYNRTLVAVNTADHADYLTNHQCLRIRIAPRCLV